MPSSPWKVACLELDRMASVTPYDKIVRNDRTPLPKLFIPQLEDLARQYR